MSTNYSMIAVGTKEATYLERFCVDMVDGQLLIKGRGLPQTYGTPTVLLKKDLVVLCLGDTVHPKEVTIPYTH